MYTEVQTAVTFLAKLFHSKSSSAAVTPEKLAAFQQALVERMLEHYKGHWDPQRPCRGNAFRALCILNGCVEPVISDAVRVAGLKLADLSFPPELVLWVDPHCVSYRIGDFGQVVTVWENRAVLDSEAVEIPHFFKANHRTRSPSFSRAQSQTPPPAQSQQQQQSQSPPPPMSQHYQYQKAVMAN
ncbi:uncharacterized protein EV422DRAFT_107053 [Fimicolochytrium jonesii]|uniref:uncharacterized protein n=1 Tax=Fimicolochytrium jonesii TaxID=1396493 RepID=UPI0022FDE73F|nr:uncharacterized protein EV422DRAFT_107053 [Fimicolochytrium jonesii]KAI8819305.1 hypothetical protein EV422DRAFT_107053 [Fimicolochytrium jonesii]